MESDPIARFVAARDNAAKTEPLEATPVALATADANGRPSVRLVLVKVVDARGFCFFTNLESRKGTELVSNPFAALAFHWPSLEEQVRVEGPVERLTPAEEDAYFASRPRESQIGAWASRQSQPCASREELEGAFKDKERVFGSGPVSRPPFWGGYRLVPDRIEFWKGGAHRLHDRWVYVRKVDGQWSQQRLYP